jgi:hypothetical protein
MKICNLFSIEVAKSRGIEDYESGEIPFVTNTESNNGIVKYVEPFEDDIVFQGPAICISGLGYATIHYNEFLPKGNGGDSCTILKSIFHLEKIELLYYAALFNTLHSWRFSFGRKASKRRIENLDLAPTHNNIQIDLKEEILKNNEIMSKYFIDSNLL